MASLHLRKRALPRPGAETPAPAIPVAADPQVIDLETHPPDPQLVDEIGIHACLRLGVAPVRRMGRATLVATAHPERLQDLRARMPAGFGEVIFAICTPEDVQTALLRSHGHRLVAAAETRVPEGESCRFWYGSAPRYILCAGILGLAGCLMAAPAATLAALSVWALACLLLNVLMKALAVLAVLRKRPMPEQAIDAVYQPVVSVMVPLLHEENIAHHLIARLERLRYPRDKLDICLLTEEDDPVTRQTLRDTVLPDWMRVITVPTGSLKTKPRALNYALDLCRGSIIGIYDAEDAPDPDQIDKVVRRFAVCPDDVACLQGKLDFYNSTQNALARCFTIDYASWFRIVLPGIERLGLVVPLGGTTLFLRREVIEQVGGWDAHNVTEDADLGVRLARHGYRTELLDTVTHEEANCHLWPWIKQRSRWIKGFAMTWSVHMRRPAMLWRQLGAWRFLGFQAMFLASISQFLLVPVLWSFWMVPFYWDKTRHGLAEGGQGDT